MSNEETRADELMAEGDKFAKRMSVWGVGYIRQQGLNQVLMYI